MNADELLARMEGVKITGAGRWIAQCPAHQDRRASLSIRELDDGRVLFHCFAGCSVHEVVAAMGLEIGALFPQRNPDGGKTERRPYSAADILRCIGFEALVVSVAAASLAAGEPLNAVDRDRLKVAAERIRNAIDFGGFANG